MSNRSSLTFVATAEVDTASSSQGFHFTLNQPATGVDDRDVIVQNLSQGWTADRTAAGWGVLYDGSNGHLRVDVAEGNAAAPAYLPDGNYEVLLSGSGINDAAGNPFGDDYVSGVSDANELFFLNGDFNRDRVIGLADYQILSDSYYAGGTGKTHDTGDMNGDGVVTQADYDLASERYGLYLPPPPSGSNSLVAYATSPSETILLWNEPTWAYDGFRVWRGTDDFDQKLVAELRPGDYSTFNRQGSGPSISWTEAGLQDGTKYSYRIRSFTDAAGNSHASNKFSTVTVLPAVDNLSADVQDDRTVRLNWDIASESHTQFGVYLSEDDGQTWIPVEAVDPDQSTLTVDWLSGGASFTFAVVAEKIGENGNVYQRSAPSRVTVRTPLPPPHLVGAARALSEPETMEVWWTVPESAHTGLRLEQRIDGGQWAPLASLEPYQNDFDFPATDGHLREFRVLAEQRDDAGALLHASDPSSAFVLDDDLTAPSGVSAVAVSETHIRVDWTDRSAGETGYRVERSGDGGLTWTHVGDAAANTTSFLDAVAGPGVAYRYRIFAKGRAGVMQSAGRQDPHPVDSAEWTGTKPDAYGYNDEFPDLPYYSNGPFTKSVEATEINVPHTHVDIYFNMELYEKWYHYDGLSVGDYIEIEAKANGQLIWRMRQEIIHVNPGAPVYAKYGLSEREFEAPYGSSAGGPRPWIVKVRFPTKSPSVTLTFSEKGAVDLGKLNYVSVHPVAPKVTFNISGGSEFPSVDGQPTQPITGTLTRSGPGLDESLTVDLELLKATDPESAEGGRDFTGPISIKFPPKILSLNLNNGAFWEVADDNDLEPNETARIKLLPGDTYLIDTKAGVEADEKANKIGLIRKTVIQDDEVRVIHANGAGETSITPGAARMFLDLEMMGYHQSELLNFNSTRGVKWIGPALGKSRDVKDAIWNAVETARNRPLPLALTGYSWGAGAIHDAMKDILASRRHHRFVSKRGFSPIDLQFSGTVDALRLTWAPRPLDVWSPARWGDPGPLAEKIPSTQLHHNYYQDGELDLVPDIRRLIEAHTRRFNGGPINFAFNLNMDIGADVDTYVSIASEVDPNVPEGLWANTLIGVHNPSF